MKLTSADVMHSFWVPQLAGKTDLLPNRVNEMWIDPQSTGLYVGQCAQFCGTQHAKMLLRVYVDTPEQFQQWIATSNRRGAGRDQAASPMRDEHAAATLECWRGRKMITARSTRTDWADVFEQQACINCHTVAGTVANGRYRSRPDAPDEPRRRWRRERRRTRRRT